MKMIDQKTIESFISDKIEIRTSSVDGKGLFAKQKIVAGEIVAIKGGHITSKDEMYSSSVINSYFPIDDNFFLAAVNEEEEDKIKIFINHSCNPNVGIRGDIVFVAMRGIDAGEEATTDYGFIDNEEYSFECTCGSEDCRKVVTGFDWKIEKLQRKYGRYFASYLEEKLNKGL